MSITFACGGCGRQYKVDESLVGRRGNCKACGHRFTIPGAEATPPPAPAPAAPAPSGPAPPRRAAPPGGGEGAAPAATPKARPGSRSRVIWLLAGAGALAGLVVAWLLLRPGAGDIDGGQAAAQGPGPAAAAPDPAEGSKPQADPAIAEAAPRPDEAKPAPDVVGEIRRFEGHTDVATSVAFAPDGRSAVSGGDTTIRLWDLESGREVRRYENHGVPVKFVGFAPDGRKILSGGDDGILCLWDAQSDRELARLEGHTGQINRLAISPDGRRAASTCWDKTLRAWDLESGKESYRVDFDGPTVGVAYSPDGGKILVTSGDHTARLLDAGSGRELRRFEGYTAWVGEGAFAPDGRTIATGGGLPDGPVRLWDIEGKEELRRFAPGPDGGWSIVFTPDSRRLLVAEVDQVVLVEVATGSELHRYQGHEGQIDCVRISPDGRRFLSAGADKTVRLWGLPAADPGVSPTPPAPAPTPTAGAAPTAPGEPPPAALLAKAAEARRQVDADEDGSEELQDAFKAALRAAAPALNEVAVGSAEQPSRFARIMLNNQRLGFDGLRFKAPADGLRRDMKWEFIMPAVDNERGRAMKAWYIIPLEGDMFGFTGYSLGKDAPVEGVDLPRKYHVVQDLKEAQIRPGSEYLIWFSFEADSPAVPAYVRIDLVPPEPKVQARIRASEAALRRTFELPESPCGLGASPDGRAALMVAGSAIYRGDAETGQVEKRWDGPAGNVRTAAFSPDGKLAAVGCGDGKVLIVDVDAGKELRACEGHSGSVRCLAFLPDGKHIVSGGEDRTARLWDVATGKQARSFEGHTDQVLCLAVAPDGRRLVTGPSIEDRVARVWDVATGKLVARLEGNEESVYALAFAPDGKSVLTGGADTSLRLYNAANGRPIRRFKPDNGAVLHAVTFLPDGDRVIAGSEGAFLTFWSAAAGRYLDAYEGPFAGTHLLAPAPGGGLLSGSGDRTVRLWSLPPAGPVPIAAAPTEADLGYLKTVSDDLEDADLDALAEMKQLSLNEKITDAGLEHLSRLANLESLWFSSGGKIRGPGFAHLAKLPRLVDLDLPEGLDEAAIARLAPLKGLKRLSLDRTKLTDAGMAALKGMTELEELRLGETSVRGPGLANLKGMTKLKSLSFVAAVQTEPTPLGDAGLLQIKDLPALEYLSLDETSITDAGMATLLQLKPLKALSLRDTKVGDAGLARLAAHPGITDLDLHRTRITDAGLKALTGMKSLKDLSLRVTKITDAGLVHLAGMTQLESLDLGYTSIGDPGMQHLKGLANLKGLRLEETNVSDQSIPIIEGFKRLEFMNPRDSKITEGGEDKLRKELPDLDIDHG